MSCGSNLTTYTAQSTMPAPSARSTMRPTSSGEVGDWSHGHFHEIRGPSACRGARRLGQAKKRASPRGRACTPVPSGLPIHSAEKRRRWRPHPDTAQPSAPFLRNRGGRRTVTEAVFLSSWNPNSASASAGDGRVWFTTATPSHPRISWRKLEMFAPLVPRSHGESYEGLNKIHPRPWASLSNMPAA